MTLFAILARVACPDGGDRRTPLFKGPAMPIIVICTKCGTKLSAPDHGAGKQVRCPKPNCGTIVAVPAFTVAEVVVAEIPAVQPTPKQLPQEDEYEVAPKKSRKRANEEDERPRNTRRAEDEDEVDDSPKPRKKRPGAVEDAPRPVKRRRKARKGLGVGAIIALVMAGLLVLSVVGYGVFLLVNEVGEASKPKSPPPPGWKEFTYTDDKFKAYFPQEPWHGTLNFNVQPMLDKLGVDVNYPESMAGYQTLTSSTHVSILVARYKKRLSSQERSEALRTAYKDRDFGEAKRVRWLGQSADEYITPGTVMRAVVVGSMFFSAEIGNTTGGRAKPEEEAGFFDNIQILN